MASLARSSLLPQCLQCTRRVTRLGVGAWDSQQPQRRSISKAAKEAERNIVVQLQVDMPQWGPKGSYVPLNPARMRNQWFPRRRANYVPVTILKQLQAQGISLERDLTYGVELPVFEEKDTSAAALKPKPFVRPVEVDFLSPARSMELLTTFTPATIDFERQQIEQEAPTVNRRYGASDAADILSAAALSKNPKIPTNAIYGSVSAADVVVKVKAALSHNDEAARVIITENDVKFLEGHAEGDASRVKTLGMFKVAIKVGGSEEPITRNVRVRAQKKKDA